MSWAPRPWAGCLLAADLALRNSLMLGLIVAGLSTVIGVFLGLAAGYAGGWLDRVLSFLMDALLCIPTLPILILMAALFGGQLALPVMRLALVIFNWPYPARQVRAVALTMREREFINVAWFSGETSVRILIAPYFPLYRGLVRRQLHQHSSRGHRDRKRAGGDRALECAAGDAGHDDLLGDRTIRRCWQGNTSGSAHPSPPSSRSLSAFSSFLRALP